jgi:hypothetical protein
MTETAVFVVSLQMHNGNRSAAQSTAYFATFGMCNVLIKNLLKGSIETIFTIIPFKWNGETQFGHLIDMRMHLLGLGIAKSVNKFLLRSCLVRMSNMMLVSMKQLHLEWRKALPLGTDQKLGGWVSENHFGWVIICRMVV